MHFHCHLRINEEPDGKGAKCQTCGSKTALIVAPPNWSVDQEAFEAGNRTDDDPDIPEDVDVHDEITAHYCLTCESITAISVNTV